MMDCPKPGEVSGCLSKRQIPVPWCVLKEHDNERERASMGWNIALKSLSIRAMSADRACLNATQRGRTTAPPRARRRPHEPALSRCDEDQRRAAAYPFHSTDH